MALGASSSVVGQLKAIFEGGSVLGLSDRQLVERYTAGGGDPTGQAAFAALVGRHGPMVLRVCREVLGDYQHAEDAFQAVFLVLARKARAIREPDLLGNWLYGVAIRTARCARLRIARRRREEGDAMRGLGAGRCAPVGVADPPADGPAVAREQAEALHEEIARLPRAFRRPVVLCDFEGLTLDEAARRLRCPAGTVHSRLARARERLRVGLSRRGIALTAAALSAALAPRPASASIPPLLCETTTKAAIAFAARRATGGALSAPVAALAQEVLQIMTVHKLCTGFATVLALATLATGADWLTRSMAMRGDPMRDSAAPAAQAAPRPSDRLRPQSTPDPAPAARMTVTGRVIRPDGRPAANVSVDIIGAPRAPESDTDVDRAPYLPLGRGSSGDDGRFRIEAAPASLARFSAIYALAGSAGPGSGFGCVELHPGAEAPAAEVHLPPEQIIRGRLVAISGQPAAGVEVQLRAAHRQSTQVAGVRFDSAGYLWPAAPGGLRAWPKPVATDAQGRFAVACVGRGLDVVLSVSDPRFAQQDFNLAAADRDAGRAVSLALHPPRLLEGRVLAADTGQPIPNAVISVWSISGPTGAMFTTRSRADDRGRFRINPYAGNHFGMRAVPPSGQPYLPAESEFDWTTAAVKKELDLTLPRGVLIRGKVTEQGTGRPVPGAGIRFVATDRPRRRISGDASAGDDGSFRVAVPPGRGYLLVLGPSLDYVPMPIAGGELYGRRGDARGWRRHYAHDIIPYDVGAGASRQEVRATLRPGRTLRGRVVGPEGRAVGDAVILIRQQINLREFVWRAVDPIHARDGRFELPGFDLEATAPAYFLDAAHEWGAAIELSGRQADEALTIQLQPCGRAKARFVGPGGQPVAGLNVLTYFHLLMTPGAMLRIIGEDNDPLPADTGYPLHFDFGHYPDGPIADADGRVVLPDLIPGAPYRISDWSTRNDASRGVQIRKDFTVRPGETLDLGDILIEKPPG